MFWLLEFAWLLVLQTSLDSPNAKKVQNCKSTTQAQVEKYEIFDYMIVNSFFSLSYRCQEADSNICYTNTYLWLLFNNTKGN